MKAADDRKQALLDKTEVKLTGGFARWGGKANSFTRNSLSNNRVLVVSLLSSSKVVLFVQISQPSHNEGSLLFSFVHRRIRTHGCGHKAQNVKDQACYTSDTECV
jgi:hypothetical protein